MLHDKKHIELGDPVQLDTDNKRGKWEGNVYRPSEEKYSTAWWKEIKMAVIRRDHYRCFRCEKKYKVTLSVHHLIPRDEGGEDNPENLITLCVECHNIVEMAGCKTRAEILATLPEDIPIKQRYEPEPDRVETFERPEWHKWVYGGQKKPE